MLPLFFENPRATLEPYFRYESYDTHDRVQDGGFGGGVGYTRDPTKDIELFTAGLQWKPIPQVVLKVDYRNFDPRQADRADEIQALIGYVF